MRYMIAHIDPSGDTTWRLPDQEYTEGEILPALAAFVADYGENWVLLLEVRPFKSPVEILPREESASAAEED